MKLHQLESFRLIEALRLEHLLHEFRSWLYWTHCIRVSEYGLMRLHHLFDHGGGVALGILLYVIFLYLLLRILILFFDFVLVVRASYSAAVWLGGLVGSILQSHSESHRPTSRFHSRALLSFGQVCVTFQIR